MNIVLIEDDLELGVMIQDYLEQEGFCVHWLQDGINVVEKLPTLSPSLVILDMMLPEIDGIEICRLIKKSYQTLVVMLTAKGDDMTEVAALNTGADAFLNKPIRPHVLLAHINAMLRLKPTTNTEIDDHWVTVQNIKINTQTLQLFKNDEEVILTSGEFQLIKLLASQVGKVVNMDVLYKSLRGMQYDGSDRSLDLRISSIRRKLNDDQPPYCYIKTIRGQGYLLVGQ